MHSIQIEASESSPRLVLWIPASAGMTIMQFSQAANFPRARVPSFRARAARPGIQVERSESSPRLVLWIPASAGMTGVWFPWVSDLTSKKVSVIPGKRSATRNPGRALGVVTKVGSLDSRLRGNDRSVVSSSLNIAAIKTHGWRLETAPIQRKPACAG